jgi:putative ABC transport system ATP-binding protein
MRDVRREVGAGERARTILRQVDLAVPRGSLMHLVGPSGSGKSSIVRLINRLDEPTSGTIQVLGQAITDWPVRDLRRSVAMVFQEPTLLDMDVRSNLCLPFQLNGSMPTDIDQRIDKALQLAGADTDLLSREAGQLSVGQKQRVTLARALITEPQMLLLDEPTSGLDRRTAEALLDRLGELARAQRMTMVIVTHRLEEARRMGGRMAVVVDGRIEAADQVDRLLDDPPPGPACAFLLGEEACP